MYTHDIQLSTLDQRVIQNHLPSISTPPPPTVSFCLDLQRSDVTSGSHSTGAGPTSDLATHPFSATISLPAELPPSAPPGQLAALTPPLLTPPPPGVSGVETQSHDSHVMQLPLLPAPPSLSTDSYPSTHQDSQSGRPNVTGQLGNRTDSKREPRTTIGSGLGLHKGDGSGIEPHRGARSGMGPCRGDLEAGLYDPAGLSTEDRVSAYLAAEAGEGGRGVAAGGRGKRSGAVAMVKPKKRKRI